MKRIAFIMRDKDILGGMPVFSGTRVLVQTLLDYLAGQTINEFLDDFPTVSREQALGLLDVVGAFVESQDYANPT